MVVALDYDGVHSLALGISLGHRRGERRGRMTAWREGETPLGGRSGLNAMAGRDDNDVIKDSKPGK
jgi:hypothetical protein